jgi:hypothetical protein
MGKGILIFVMASTLSLATLYLARTEQDLASVQTESDYQEKVLARQTAQSAFNIVIAKVRAAFESESFAFTDQSYGGALYDIGAVRAEDGSVTVIAVGKYGRHSFEIIGSMTMQGQGINETMNVDGSGTEFEFKKDAVISGIDASGQTEASAVLVSDPETLEYLGGEENHIEGSMVLGESSTLMSAIESAILTYPDKLEYSALGPNDTKQNIGSPSSPEIVVVNGDVTLDNGFEGYGILYVDGNLTINNGAMWYGIVFVTGGDSELEMKKDSYIEGTLFLDGIEEMDMKKDTRVQYNSEALEMLGYFLEAIDTEGQNEVIRQVANTSYRDGQEMGNAYIDDSVTEARNLLN